MSALFTTAFIFFFSFSFYFSYKFYFGARKKVAEKSIAAA